MLQKACTLLMLTWYVQMCLGQSLTGPTTSMDFVLENGRYWQSSSVFEQDCSVQCDANTVRYNKTITSAQILRNLILQAYAYSDEVENALHEMHGTWEGFHLQQNVTLSWNATRCTRCDSLTDPNTHETIDHAMYSMDKDCTPTCYHHLGYYNLQHIQEHVFIVT